MKKIFTYLLGFLFLFGPISALAQEPVLQVATIERHPFVIQTEEGLTGFSIELWNEIARENNWEYEFLVQKKFTDLLAAPRVGKADLSIANISITADREEVMDFSTSIYSGGMLIMVSNAYTKNHLLAALSDKTFWMVILWLGLFFAACVLALFVLNRIKGSGDRQFGDIIWRLGTLGSLGEDMPKTAITKFVFLIWMIGFIFGLVIAAAQLTSSLVLLQQTELVSDISDLQGREVGVIGGSTSEAYLRSEKIDTVSFSSIDSLFKAVAKGSLDAVVHDAPVIDYYVANRGAGKTKIAGELFNPEQYGIALPTGSLLTEQINQTLLRLQEDGTYDDLHVKWFAQ